MSETWFKILDMGINIAILGLVFKGTRSFSKIEFKVDLMWEFFHKELERRKGKGEY